MAGAPELGLLGVMLRCRSGLDYFSLCSSRVVSSFKGLVLISTWQKQMEALEGMTLTQAEIDFCKSL